MLAPADGHGFAIQKLLPVSTKIFPNPRKLSTIILGILQTGSQQCYVQLCARGKRKNLYELLFAEANSNFLLEVVNFI